MTHLILSFPVHSQRKFTLSPFFLPVLNFSKCCLFNSTWFTALLPFLKCFLCFNAASSMISCSLGNHLLNTKMLSNFILQNAIFENVDNICFEQNCIGMMVLSSFFYSCFIFTYTSFNSYSTGAITNFPSLRKQGSF